MGLLLVRRDVTGPSCGPMIRDRSVARAGWSEKGESGGVEVSNTGGVTGAKRLGLGG